MYSTRVNIACFSEVSRSETSITALMFSSYLSFHFWKRLGYSPAGLCWEMSEQIWHSWRCVVSLLIAIDTSRGVNSTPLNIILCVDGWEELNSPSSLVLPELCLQGTPLPLHVAKSFCVQNFSEIPFSFCPQPLNFSRADWHTASDWAVPHPYSSANPVHPPFGCLQPSFCVSSLLHDQLWEPLFLSLLPCFQVSCAAQCWVGWNCYLHVTLLSYSWTQRGCRSTGLPWTSSSCLNMEGRWKPV